MHVLRRHVSRQNTHNTWDKIAFLKKKNLKIILLWGGGGSESWNSNLEGETCRYNVRGKGSALRRRETYWEVTLSFTLSAPTLNTTQCLPHLPCKPSFGEWGCFLLMGTFFFSISSYSSGSTEHDVNPGIRKIALDLMWPLWQTARRGPLSNCLLLMSSSTWIRRCWGCCRGLLSFVWGVKYRKPPTSRETWPQFICKSPAWTLEGISPVETAFPQG